MTRRAPTFRDTTAAVAIWVGGLLFSLAVLRVAGEAVWFGVRAIGRAVAG